MFAFPFDATTVGCVVDVVAVVGVEVVAVVAALPDGAVVADVDADDAAEVFDAAEVLDTAVGAAALAAFEVALVVAPPAWAARPANRPVPVIAPASDQRVSCVIRRKPASRFRRLLRLSVWRSMSTIVGIGSQRRLGSR